ncbi:MAG: hypothetical protein K6G61_04660 [Solobacterium sp.]|nr:hypothetical protein [Solobacterium sp.]
MKKTSLRKRLSYRFDNLMSKGTPSLLLILAVITAVTVLAGAFAAIALGGPDGSGGNSAGSTIWFTLMHALSSGVLAKEEGTVAYLFVMTIVTFVGIFITSFLIGTVSNAIKEKLVQLQRGRSSVIEEGHTVILGFDENVTEIIRELIYANENKNDACCVIMADHDKTDMEDTIRDEIDDTGSLRIICRSGRPDSVHDLKVCSLDTCRSVIVNLEDDFMCVKTILACEELLNETDNDAAYITAVIRDREVLQPAKIAGGQRVEILNFHKTMARLMVQAGRHPGMSEILSQLLSFKGNEIYVEDGAPAAGYTLAEVNQRLPDICAVGILRSGELLFNPDPAVKVEKDDSLIVIAEDDNGIRLEDAAEPDESVFAYGQEEGTDPDTMLILGSSDLLRQILIEENAYAPAGSRVIIAAEEGALDMDALPDLSTLTNIRTEVRECSIYRRNTLEKLCAENPSGILLLSDTRLEAEEADAKTLMLQLLLTDISAQIGADVPLIIEMNSTHNQKLSQMMRGTDFVVSSRIAARMMAHISEQRQTKDILNSLLSEGGSGIYMKPAARYVQTGRPVSFHTLQASAARNNEIAIGYKKFTGDGSFTIQINPGSSAQVEFTEKDDVILICDNLL